MKTKCNDNKIDLTLGELIAAVSEAAFVYSHDTKDAYHLARLVLMEILQGPSPGSETNDRRFPGTPYRH